MFNIGPTELILILGVALIVFGPGKLPELGQMMGKTIREFKGAINNIDEDIKKDIKDIKKEVDEVKDAVDIRSAIQDIQNDVKNSVKLDLDLNNDTDKKESSVNTVCEQQERATTEVTETVEK